MRTRLLAAAALVALASGCATVRWSRVRSDYDAIDKRQTKRLVIVTHPLPDGKPKVGELWSKVARDYVNLKRQFIIKAFCSAGGAAFDPRSQCAEGVEGVLWLDPKMTPRDAGFESQVKASLVRCRDGQEVWAAEAGGTWRSDDEGLKETVKLYSDDLGPEVAPYVVPTWRLLIPTLNTLPDPILNEEEKDEKIELSAAPQPREDLARR